MEETYKLEDLQKMKVPDLKKILKDRGLTVAGNKSDLINRVLNISDGGLDLSTGEAVEDDSVLDESSEQILADQSPDVSAIAADAPVAIATTLPATTTASKPITMTVTKPVMVAAADADVSKVVSKPSADNGMAARMKRFGVVSEQARKVARQERFQSGTAASSSASKSVSSPDVLKKRAERFGAIQSAASASSATSSAVPVDVGVLKKRAERFGQVTATKLAKVDEEQRALKRKARFGEIRTPPPATTKTTVADSATATGDINVVKKRRLERFGASVAVQ